MDHAFITSVSRMTQVQDILDALYATYPTAYVETLVCWALGPSMDAYNHADLTDTDRLFTTAILEHKRYRAGLTHSLNRISVGREFDQLGRNELIDNWSISKLVCHLVASQVTPTKRCAAVVGMRDEGSTALEWVAHYQAIGVERLFIYTNDNIDGSNEILEVLARHGEIVLFENDVADDVYPQFKIYEHFLFSVPEARDYRWCCFFDSDEFFVPAVDFNHDVRVLVDHVDEVASFAGAIWFPWRWVVSDYRFDRAPGTLAERFHHSIGNPLVKSIARLSDVIGLKPLHSPYLRGGSLPLDAKLSSRTMDELFVEKNWPEDIGQLHHYWCKSFEEFYLKKRRGDSIKLSDNAYKRDLTTFFAWNGSNATTPDTPQPVAVLAAARKQLERLLALDGMSTAVAATDARFRTLVERDASGTPLRQVYESYRRSVPIL